MTAIKSITVTDVHGNDWTDAFRAVFDFDQVATGGEGFGEAGHGDLFDAEGFPLSSGGDSRGLMIDDERDLVETILKAKADALGWSMSAEWRMPLGAYILAFYDGKTAWADAIEEDGEDRGRFEFSTVVFALALVVAIEWMPTPELPPLTRSQQLAANDAGGMFDASPDTADRVTFLDHTENGRESVGITISAGWSPLDPRTKLVMIDTDPDVGPIRVMVNEHTAFDRDPERHA